MESDPLIAYGWQDFVEIATIVLMLGLVSTIALFKNSFAGDFYFEAPLFVILLTAAAVMLLAIATFLSSNL